MLLCLLNLGLQLSNHVLILHRKLLYFLKLFLTLFLKIIQFSFKQILKPLRGDSNELLQIEVFLLQIFYLALLRFNQFLNLFNFLIELSFIYVGVFSVLNLFLQLNLEFRSKFFFLIFKPFLIFIYI